MLKALLFINGIPPKEIPNLEEYQLVACTDGAFLYLKSMGFPLQKLDFISGDFDSYQKEDHGFEFFDKMILTPDQNKTDFDKALDIILEKGFNEVDVLGASGGEMDHFLGNLTVAFKFKDKMKIAFYDEFSTYFFVPRNLVLEGVKGKMISLYPYPSAEGVKSTGLNWPLDGENLEMTTRIGTRNFATEDRVVLEYQQGNLLVFIGEKYL